MKDIKQQEIYNQITKKIQNEVEHTLTIINKEMEKDLSTDTIKNLSNYFIILSNLNQAIQLISNIKPSK